MDIFLTISLAIIALVLLFIILVLQTIKAKRTQNKSKFPICPKCNTVNSYEVEYSKVLYEYQAYMQPEWDYPENKSYDEMTDFRYSKNKDHICVSEIAFKCRFCGNIKVIQKESF